MFGHRRVHRPRNRKWSSARRSKLCVPVVPGRGFGWPPAGSIMQVNGFAGVDYNDPLTPHEEHRALHPRTVRHRGDALLPYCDHRRAGTHGRRRSAISRARKTDCRKAPPWTASTWKARTSRAEDGPRGAHPRQWVRQARFRRVPPLAGGHGESRPHRDALARLARSAALHRAGRWRRAWPRQSATPRPPRAQIADAVSAGATLSTHLGNGAHAMLPRHPNYIWDQLAEDRLMADFIVDGIHLDPGFLKVALRAKGIARSVLVTDAATPAGAAPGRYRLGEQEVELTPDGRVVLAGTGPAGRQRSAHGSRRGEPHAAGWAAAGGRRPHGHCERGARRQGAGPRAGFSRGRTCRLRAVPFRRGIEADRSDGDVDVGRESIPQQSRDRKGAGRPAPLRSRLCCGSFTR